jgi:thioredoxin-related protein
MTMKNKLFLFAIATIATSASLMALPGRAGDSKSEPDLPQTSSPAVAPGKTGSQAAEWSTDYDAALKLARATHRPILLDFTGSDWCGWCMKLDREILATPEFKRYADQHLVLVKIDFPMHQAQSDAEKARNEQLAARFQVEGFPTLVLLNPGASAIGTLGYMRGGPGAFIERLTALLASQP